MAIDARIKEVVFEGGSGSLRLVGRPNADGKVHNGPGQGTLYFEEAPPRVTELLGCDIWGGSNNIVLGDVVIAERVSYTSIKFHDEATFNDALNKYRLKRRPDDIHPSWLLHSSGQARIA